MKDLSHLGREVHRRYDDLGVIQVFDDGNKRFLSFGTADEQSCQLRVRPDQPQHHYSRAMFAVISVLEQPPQRAAVMGVGGGVLIRALHHRFTELTIDAVDLRKAVISIAQQYFGLPRDARIRPCVSDAGEFLQQVTPASYDLLFSDLYLAEGLETGQLQAEFLDNARQALTDQGWLVLNLWKEHREDGCFLPLLRERFRTVLHATTTDGNWIVWASPHSDYPDKKAVQLRAKQSATELGFNLWQSARGFFRHR